MWHRELYSVLDDSKWEESLRKRRYTCVLSLWPALVKDLPAVQETLVPFLDREEP